MMKWSNVEQIDFAQFKIELNRRLRMMFDGIDKIRYGVPRTTHITATETLKPSQYGSIVCSSSAAITLNLPTVVGNLGLPFNVANFGSGVVTIDPNGTEKIMNSSTIALNQYESASIVADLTVWIK